MEDLKSLRLRHAALACLYNHLKSFHACHAHSLYGQTDPAEQALLDSLAQVQGQIEQLLEHYYAIQETLFT